MNFTATLEEDPETGDLILPLPPEMFDQYGWKEGDILDFEVKDDNVIIVTNKSLQERESAK